MSESDTPDEPDETIALTVEGVGQQPTLSKAEQSQQLSDRRVRSLNVGVKPPYNPDRLAAFLERNETLATGIRKKSRYEVGFGFEIVPAQDYNEDEADETQYELARSFWRGQDSRWQTRARQRAEPSTPEEVKELARQDYHLIGWQTLEVLTDLEGRPVGLAHVPANTVRVRKPQSRYDQPRHPEEGRFVGGEDADLASRGYVQVRDGRRRYFGQFGDRYRGLEATIVANGEDEPPEVRYVADDSDEEPIFVDRETGDVVRGSAEDLENAPANELIFIRNPSPLTDDYGVPDWVSAIRTISADEAAKDYNRDFFDNDTIPRFVIKVYGGELKEESKRELREMLNGLREESHRSVILEVEKFQNTLEEDVEIELEPLGQGISEEMDFRQFREKNEHEIAKVLEMPPIKIGNTETSNRSNSDVQDREFALEVIQPEQHKLAERIYQTIHQTALGITDWTIEYELRGADQPRQDAETARRKINAVNGAIPVNRALEMIGEDPLPDDVDIDGDSTLIADIGGGGGQPGGEPGGEPSVEEQLPPEDNKIGERDWDDVKADLATKEIETQQFSSSNLDEGLYDYDEQELYLSFKREGQSSLYAYVDVPPAEWSGLTNASSHGSYHYDNIRLAYGYVEITNFHDRLPEGPIPDDPPDDVPTQLSASCGGRDFSERRKTPEGVPNDAFHIDDESECDGTVHEGPRGGLYCSPDGGDNTPGPDTIQEEAPEQWDGSDESREQVQDAVESAVAEGAGVSEALEAAREHIDNLDASGERVVAETAYIHQTESVEVGGQTVESGPVVSDAYSTNISEIREAAESELDTESYEHPRLDDTHASQQDFNGWREERDGSLLNSDTAELWGAAIDTTGNDNVPDDAAADPDTVGDPLPAAEGDEPVTAIGDSISVTRETLRETFGDTVPVARGVSGEFAEEIREAAENGEDIDIEHRALESWSTFPAHAERFAQEGDDGGIIIRTEIPVDEVWGSSHTTPGLAEEENELIVGKDGPESYSPENIYTPDDGDLTDLYVDAAEA